MSPTSSHLVHARIVGIDEETTEIDPVGSNTWRRTSPGGLVIEERSQSTNAAGNIEELRVFKGPNLVSVRETLFEYHDFPWGREVIRRVEDPAGAALTTQYAFYDTPSQIATNGRLKHTILPDGNWSRQEYHLSGPAMGRVQRVLRPWLDAPSHPDFATPSNSVATTYAYVADWTGAVRAVSDETTTVLGTTTQRTATQWDFSQTAQYLFDAPQGPSAPITVATVSRYAGASAAPEVSVIKTLRASAPTPAKFWNKPVQIVAPHGVAADYRYQVGVWDPVNGVFTPNGYFPTGTDIAEYSTQSPLMVGKSLRTVTVKVAGLPVLNTVSVWDHPFGPNGQDPNQPANWLLVSTEETQYNASLKPVWRQRGPRYDWSTGVAWTATYSAEGRLEKEIGEDGVDVRYVYDAMGRVTRKTIKGQANPTYNSITLPAIPDRIFDFTYDAAGQVVQEKISGASESLVTNHVIDKAGRKTQTRVPGPSGQLTTTFAYSMLGTGGTQVTATAPDGGTSIQKTFRDGRKSAEEGTAQVNKTWTYQIGIDGRLTTTVAEGTRWGSTTADWLGRTVASTRPTQAGGTYVETQEYNSAGQLVASGSSFPGSRPTRYVYNALGERIREGVDMDNNGTLDPASADRITDSDTTIGFVMSGQWPNQLPSRSERITRIHTYGVTGSGTATLLKDARQKLGWWQMLEYEWAGTSGDVGVSERQSKLDNSGTTKVATKTGAATEMKIESAGKILRTISGPITTTYQYDDCDRFVTQTDARKGDTEFVYFANSAMLSAMIDAADLAASRITEVYQYNAAGRRIATTDAKNLTRRVEYDLHGRVVREWGSASYPVERSYCSCGKIVELRTYRGGTGWSGAAWPRSS